MNVTEHPVWRDRLQHLPKCDLENAETLLTRIDIRRARSPSALWRLTGFGAPGTERELGHDTVLRSALICIVSGAITEPGTYRDVYDDYIARSKVSGIRLSEHHRHNRAFRYTVKMFLVDLYVVWREAEGLATSDPWDERVAHS